MDKTLFKDGEDYWQVAQQIKNLYMSEGSLLTLLDFERVLDEFDLYAFKNWCIGELVAGPEVSKYRISCTFMWPKERMPDPRGPLRLLPFDCDVKWRKTMMKIPIKIRNPSDYVNGTRLAKMVERPIWLVEISMPKNLMSDIRTGSIELEDQEIDLEDLDKAYEEDLPKEEYQSDQTAQPTLPNEMNPNAQAQPTF